MQRCQEVNLQMRRHTKLLLTALTAAIVLASAVGTASARNLSISNQSFLTTWNPLTFSTEAEGGGIRIECRVTLEGSFHYRTIPKILRHLIGYITSANVRRPCTGGEGFAETRDEGSTETLPWHITYEGFEGRLPAIEGIRLLLRPWFIIQNVFTGGRCRYTGNVQGVVKLTRGVATAIVPDGTIPSTRWSGGGLCPPSGFFSAGAEQSSISLQLRPEVRITVTLI
jgi:hypothetical protein